MSEFEDKTCIEYCETPCELLGAAFENVFNENKAGLIVEGSFQHLKKDLQLSLRKD